MEFNLEKIEIDNHSKHIINNVSFSYQSNSEDKEFIDNILCEGKKLAEKVNRHAANNSLKLRHMIIVEANAVAGLLAEKIWCNRINSEIGKDFVYNPQVKDLSNQIDISTLDDEYTFEVRSSFPRKGIEFAVSNERNGFKIVGPYNNDYKESENSRDFYLTALFHLQRPGDILSEIKYDGFCFSLTGGATLAMMDGDEKISFLDNLSPEDSLIESTTDYKVIRIRDGLDYLELIAEISKI